MSAILARPTRPRFQEAAAPLPPEARLFAWGPRALYIGPALNLTPHRNAVAVLALGLDQPFEAACGDGPYRTVRGVLVAPDALHHFRGTAGRMAFLYVDPLGRDLEILRATGAALEPELIRLLGRLAEAPAAWPETRRKLSLWLGAPPEPDARIRAALDALHGDPTQRLPLDALAHDAGLSPSRFRHLFRAVTGVTVRRYRVWVAMGSAVRAIARGENLTAAALDAGFSSSAHFSAAFREMFGLEPSRLAKGGLALTGGAL